MGPRLKRGLLLSKQKASLLLSKIRCSAAGPYVSHVLTDSFNGRLLVPASDFEVGRKLSFRGEYDRAHVETLLQFVDRQSSVLIVGAHIGSLVIPLAKAAKEVVAIEASPSNFETLLMNLAINHCTNVRSLNVAASDRRQRVRFIASKHNSGGSKIAPATLRREFVYDDPEVIEIDAAPLDEVLPDFLASLVVMDIEGGEAKAIVGMRRLLERSSTFMVEFTPFFVENIAGITCDEFLQLIPFERIQLMNDPEEQHIIEVARSRFYYGGADLLCSRSVHR